MLKQSRWSTGFYELNDLKIHFIRFSALTGEIWTEMSVVGSILNPWALDVMKNFHFVLLMTKYSKTDKSSCVILREEL